MEEEELVVDSMCVVQSSSPHPFLLSTTDAFG